MYAETRESYSPASLLASSIPLAVADRIFKSFSLMSSSMVSSCRRRVDFFCSRSGKKNWSTDTSSSVTSSYKICKLGCCPLFSMDAIYRGAMFSVSANWLRDIPFAFLAALMACPKALKSNFSLLCFIIISPIYILLFIFLSRYDYT